DEHGGPVARVGEGIIEPACAAARTQGEEAVEQLALPTARAARGEACDVRRDRPARDRHHHSPARGGPAPQTEMKVKRKSHTTSTKCQYQAANSKPRCCSGLKWPANARIRQTIRKRLPMMTCAPWKPVAMNKVAP